MDKYITKNLMLMDMKKHLKLNLFTIKDKITLAEVL